MLFLNLAYSGFLNSDMNTMFGPLEDDEKNKDKPYIKHAFENFMIEKKAQLENKSQIYARISDINYKDLLQNKEVANEHNKFIDKICQNRLEKVKPNEENKDTFFSLFFVKDNQLIEICTQNKEIQVNVLEKNVTEAKAKDKILKYIISENENGSRGIKYMEDINVFTEVEDTDEDGENLKNDGIVVIVIMSIIFMINFFLVNPENIFYDMRTNFVNFFRV